MQETPLTVFDELHAGDLLFIDSTHAVKVGSDTLRIYLEIIPRLRPGVIIHIHDIYLPYLFPRDTLTSLWWWQETALLAALLTNNDRIKIDCCLSQLHYDCPRDLAAVLQDYVPQSDQAGLPVHNDGHFPSSLWLRTVGT